MIDIHSHAIPFVDDGSKDLETSKKILSDAEKEGIDKMICTPHYRVGQFAEKKSVIEESFNILVANNPTGIKLFWGQEITVDKTVRKKLADGELLTMNNTKYVLLEYPYFDRFEIAESVYEFSLLGYLPIVAHAERYEYLTERDTEDIIDNGGLVQINASSLFASPFASFKKRAVKLLEKDAVSFVASDIHSGLLT